MLKVRKQAGARMQKTSAHQAEILKKVSIQKLLDCVIVFKGSGRKPNSHCTSKQAEKTLRECS